MASVQTVQPSKVFKILTEGQWAQWQKDDVFRGAGIDLKDGYIHLSTVDQTGGTYAKYFAEQENIVLVMVDLTKVADPIKWELSRSDKLFPHVYGNIALHAVVGKLENWKGEEPDMNALLGK